MQQSIFDNEQQKRSEWAYAKEKLTLQDGSLPAGGTKLRRQDHPELKHSFLIMNGEIIALDQHGKLLGPGLHGSVKLSEKESGELLALKRWYPSRENTSLAAIYRESHINQDLGIGKAIVSRNSGSPKQKSPKKHYMLTKYLGLRLNDYLSSKHVDDRELWMLTYRALDQIYKLNHGKLGKHAYAHYDLHLGNITINPDTGKISLIDFDRSKRQNKKEDCKSDTYRLLIENNRALEEYLKPLVYQYKTKHMSKTIIYDEKLREEKLAALREENDPKSEDFLDRELDLMLYIKKEESETDPNNENQLLFTKLYYFLPLPNGGCSESYIDLPTENINTKITLPINDGCFQLPPPLSEDGKKLNKTLQSIVEKTVSQHQTRKPPTLFIKSVYNGAGYRAWFSTEHAVRTINLAKAALLAALGIDENDYEYDPNGEIEEDDFLAILAEQNDHLENIYQTLKEINKREKKSLTPLIHHAIFLYLNNHESKDNLLDTLKNSNKAVYQLIKTEINDLFNCLDQLKKDTPKLKTTAEEENSKYSDSDSDEEPRYYHRLYNRENNNTSPSKTEYIDEKKVTNNPQKNSDVTPTTTLTLTINKTDKHLIGWGVTAAILGAAASAIGFAQLGGVNLGSVTPWHYVAALVGLMICILGTALAVTGGVKNNRAFTLAKLNTQQQQKSAPSSPNKSDLH